MKKFFTKVSVVCARIMPILATIILVKLTNSTACWTVGQDEMPEGVKKYRKF